MKRVLYISYDGMTDPLGQSQVLPYLSALSKLGYQITLLSFEKKNRFQKENKIIIDLTKSANINWVPLTFTKRPPLISKIFDRWRLQWKVNKLNRKHRFDMTHCRSYVAAEQGLRLKRRFGTKFLFDMRGFWADEKIDSGHWNINSPFFKWVYQYYKKKEKKFLLEADAIVSLTHAAKQELISKKEYQLLQIDVIPCCADFNHFDYTRISNTDLENLRNELGILPGNKIITYLGSVGGWYMTNEMFSFFIRLHDKHPEFIMLFLTKDNPVEVMKQAKNAGILEDKLLIRYVARNELPIYLGLSDCSIFFIRQTYSKIASSPTKHAELMGMGIPVICNNIGDTGFVLEQTKTGFLIKEFSTKEYDNIANSINDLMEIPKEKIRSSAFEFFDLEKGISKYYDIYKRILAD